MRVATDRFPRLCRGGGAEHAEVGNGRYSGGCRRGEVPGGRQAGETRAGERPSRSAQRGPMPLRFALACLCRQAEPSLPRPTSFFPAFSAHHSFKRMPRIWWRSAGNFANILRLLQSVVSVGGNLYNCPLLVSLLLQPAVVGFLPLVCFWRLQPSALLSKNPRRRGSYP